MLDAVGDLVALVERAVAVPVVAPGVVQDGGGRQVAVVLQHLLRAGVDQAANLRVGVLERARLLVHLHVLVVVPELVAEQAQAADL